ncbi:MAG: recombinase family protein [Ruminococcus sp.]|nr:recombinase family protein [Ruminococcus sp.]
MNDKYYIAAYCRISVDDELNKENTSIENQKAIIKEYVDEHFPNSVLDIYEDRDKSGYTFAQRPGYQEMRKKLFGGHYDMIILKDLSRFSRRNGAGLVELEAIRDEGIRFIAIGDNIDYPTRDDWLKIQVYFLLNEMPVTDTSKKVRNVIRRMQKDGKWIPSVPYGYVFTNTKKMIFEVEQSEAAVVRKVFELYNDGWGYKRIANYLTDMHIPTPRMNEKMRIEARGDECRLRPKAAWSIATIQGIIENDFYIGTLRQGKYARRKINGKDIKRSEDDHIVFENNHEAIVDYDVFVTAQNFMKERSRTSYNGERKYPCSYSGYIVCGDCGAPMVPFNRADVKPSYRCGTYHKRGLKGCTSHHIRTETLDSVIKEYLLKVRDTSSEMIERIQKMVAEETETVETSKQVLDRLEQEIEDARAEKKALLRQCAREIARKPEQEAEIQEMYDELIAECNDQIAGLQNQIKITCDRSSMAANAEHSAKIAINYFDKLIAKDSLKKSDLAFIIDKLTVYEDYIKVKLKDDITEILKYCSSDLDTSRSEGNRHGKDKIFSAELEIDENGAKSINTVSDGDPLEIYTATDGEVIFKKYSPVGEMSVFAGQYADVLSRISNLPTLISDRDHVIAAAGVSKREFLERRITNVLENYMENRKSYKASVDDVSEVFPIEGVERSAAVIYPIIAAGDVSGAVVMLKDESGKLPGDTETKLTQSAAAFLGKQMEE